MHTYYHDISTIELKALNVLGIEVEENNESSQVFWMQFFRVKIS